MTTISPLMICMGILMGLISAYLAYRRDRNPYLWFTIGFLFGLIGVFTAFFGSSKKKNTKPQPSPPILNIIGPTDKFWYYVDSQNQQQGPLSHGALVNAWKQGKLLPSTYVWNETMSDWKPLNEMIAQSTQIP